MPQLTLNRETIYTATLSGAVDRHGTPLTSGSASAFCSVVDQLSGLTLLANSVMSYDGPGSWHVDIPAATFAPNARLNVLCRCYGPAGLGDTEFFTLDQAVSVAG